MNLRLTALDLQFIRYERRPDGVHIHNVDRIDQAQGVRFICPLCFERNGNQRSGVHSVICWSKSRGVPDDAQPGPGRWLMRGTGYSDLTLDGEPGKSRSVLLLIGCKWHGFVTNGLVT